MIRDIDLSETIIQEYRTRCQNRQERIRIDLSVMILSSNSWSLSLPSPIILPTEVIQYPYVSSHKMVFLHS